MAKLKRCGCGAIRFDTPFEIYATGLRASNFPKFIPHPSGVESFWTNELFKPESVLDVGCAYGFVVKRFQELGIPATGIEYSPYAVSRAVTQEIIEGDVRNLSKFKKNSFDLVIGTELLEHIPEKDLVKAVKEMHRVAKRFVFLLICTANSDHIESRGGKGDPSHITMKTRVW